MARTAHQRMYPSLSDPIYLSLKDLRVAISRHAPQASGVIIDFGAGTQPYRSLFPASCNYMGADFDTKGANEIQITPEGKLPVADGSADWVVSFQVLEHVKHLPVFFAECRRVLKPGGTMLLSTHGTWTYHPDPMKSHGDFWRWTEEGLRVVFESEGFANIECESVCPGWRCLAQQFLVLRDPSRRKQRGFRAFLRRVLALNVNVFTEIVTPFLRRSNRKADILPICYLVRATKPS